MFGVKSLKLSLLLTWMLSSTGETRQFSVVTVGDEVTLTCKDYKEFNDECKSITWMYSDSQNAPVPLWEHGRINREAGSKSDRLSVTAECFLVIKKVTMEDDGFYTCRQFDSSGRLVTDSTIILSVTNAEKERKPGTTSSTINPSPTTTTTTIINTEAAPQTSVTPTTAAEPEPNPDLLPSLIGAAVGLTALLITTVMIIRWRKTKGSKTQMDDTTVSFNTKLSLNSAGTRSGPETSQDMADPAGDVHYASISHTNMSSTGARVDKDPDEHRVTYSTLKAPAAASTDPTDLYATIQ